MVLAIIFQVCHENRQQKQVELYKHNKTSTKKIIHKMKEQLTSWEKTSAHYVSDKGLISRLYQDLTTQAKTT